jgi:hypothetical protein
MPDDIFTNLMQALVTLEKRRDHHKESLETIEGLIVDYLTKAVDATFAPKGISATAKEDE